MPVIQQHSQETVHKMLVENANIQHPRRHHELFLRSRPYKGEPPTVAGFLLYPDTPAKMETTSREAFCFRPIPQQDSGKGDDISQNTQQQSHSPHGTPSRQTERGNSSSVDKEPEEDKQEGKHSQHQVRSTAVKTEDMQSQYQKDFPPPSSCHRRRTPAYPQPDNIGINPAFRIDFSTVQRETFPGWPIMNPRMRMASQGRHNI